MALSASLRTRIMQAIEERASGSGACPVCGRSQWILADGFVMLSVQSEPTGNLVIGGRTLPSVALICGNCGDTRFLNLLVLGLGDLIPQEAVAS